MTSLSLSSRNHTSTPAGDNLNGSLMKWIGWTRTRRDKQGGCQHQLISNTILILFMSRVKARGMVEHIGYPSELLDQSKLEELYAGLELSPNAYLGNALNMTVFGTNYAFSKLREKVNKTDSVRHGRPAVVNAFYSPLENSIQFPAGILQGIFFSSDRLN